MPGTLKSKKGPAAAANEVPDDVVTIAVEKANDNSMFCDPRLGGCANVRPLIMFNVSDSVPNATTATTAKKALCVYCASSSGDDDDDASLQLDADHRSLLRPDEGDDVLCCRSVHHDIPGGREMMSMHFRQREPRVRGGRGSEPFRIRRALACNECYNKEIEIATAAAANTPLAATSAATSSSARPVPPGASAAAIRKEKKKTRAMVSSTASSATTIPAIPPTSRVLPVAYYPQHTSPHARLDFLRSDYFALSVEGRKKWWHAAVERVLLQRPGWFAPTGEQAARIAGIMGGEQATCLTCGEATKVETGFPVKIWVTNGEVVVEHGDECLDCEDAGGSVGV
ncbi:hypothetical protein MN608_07522 [Microdochium nivale]|nr:hypothetical protein MN608_07522 [Microdochium nivale]